MAKPGSGSTPDFSLKVGINSSFNPTSDRDLDGPGFSVWDIVDIDLTS